MFGFRKNTENERFLSLQLGAPEAETERPTIIRNRHPVAQTKRRTDLYRRADGFLIRYRLNERLSI